MQQQIFYASAQSFSVKEKLLQIENCNLFVTASQNAHMQAYMYLFKII